MPRVAYCDQRTCAPRLANYVTLSANALPCGYAAAAREELALSLPKGSRPGITGHVLSSAHARSWAKCGGFARRASVWLSQLPVSPLGLPRQVRQTQTA